VVVRILYDEDAQVIVRGREVEGDLPIRKALSVPQDVLCLEGGGIQLQQVVEAGRVVLQALLADSATSYGAGITVTGGGGRRGIMGGLTIEQ